MLLTAAGLALLFVTLRDIVHELFHPETTGSISRGIMRAVWAVARWMGRRFRSAIYHAGPAMLLAVGAVWTALVATGVALVYVPQLPDGFHVAAGVPAQATHGFVTAMYVSLAMLTSVGASDLTPKAPLVRMIAVVEPILGLVLISAWITWVLSIYPVIATRRAFARQVDLLRRAQPDPARVVADAPRDAVAALLRSLTEQTVKITSELAQLRVTYYFQDPSARLTLAAQLPYVGALAAAAESRPREPLIAHDGTSLRLAVEDLLADIGDQYLGLHGAPPERVLAALARDHLLPGVGSRFSAREGGRESFSIDAGSAVHWRDDLRKIGRNRR
jgi:hypothetical protein